MVLYGIHVIQVAEFAHPVENVFGNYLPAFTGPFLFNTNLTVMYVCMYTYLFGNGVYYNSALVIKSVFQGFVSVYV